MRYMPNPEGAVPTHVRVNLNLDTVEREQTFEPYTISIGGRALVLRDPKEIDWKELLDIEQPVQFLGHVFSTDEDKAFFKKQDFPGWKLDMIIKGYTEHYGLGQSGNGVASRL